MKLKSIVVFLLLSLLPLAGNAQIQISPYACGDVEGLNESTSEIIKNKLKTMLSQKGIMSKFGNSRFILAARLSVLEKEILGTAPTKICYRLNVQLAIGDGVSGTCFETMSLEVKGVGATEMKAVTNAIRSINAKNPKFGEFVEKGNNKIYEYFENNIDNIIANAENLIAANEFDKAILELAVVPKEIECYRLASDLILKANKARINYNAAKILTEAKATWAGNPTIENGVDVMVILKDIDPSCQQYSEAQQLMNTVEKEIKALYKQKHDDEMAMRQQEIDLEKARIKSIEKIAIAEAENQPDIVYNTVLWW